MTKRVWITGASSGIGQAVALHMAKKGYELIVSGRNESLLADLAEKTGAFVLPFDVTNKDACFEAVSVLKKKYDYIDTVFLNAGHCLYVDTAHFDSHIFEQMIQTNFLSMVYCVEAVLPLLRLAPEPHLIGMSSAVAYLGLPRSEAYGASKAAIRNFLEGLRVSLKHEDITVSIVFPGFVKTPLTDANDFPMPGIVSVEKAAHLIVRGIERGTLDIKFPRWFVFVTQCISILPARWRLLISSKMVKQKWQ